MRVQTGSDRELRNTLHPVWRFLLPAGCRCVRGVSARPYIAQGSRVTWNPSLCGAKSPSRVLCYNILDITQCLETVAIWVFSLQDRGIAPLCCHCRALHLDELQYGIASLTKWPRYKEDMLQRRVAQQSVEVATTIDETILVIATIGVVAIVAIATTLVCCKQAILQCNHGDAILKASRPLI